MTNARFILLISLPYVLVAQPIDSLLKIQELPPVNVISTLVKRESAQHLHIIDFHIIRGDMYTLRNDIHKPQIKYLCKNDSCFLIDKKAKIFHKDYRGRLIISMRDSIFLLNQHDLQPLGTISDYTNFLDQLIGETDDFLYFKNNFFYQLIDEYVSYRITKNESHPIYLTHDSASFSFLAHHYKDIANKIYLQYTYPHPKAHRYFLNTEKIRISKLNERTGQLFKSLKGSGAFESMTHILERSRSEGMMVGDTFYINDFNSYELLRIHRDETRSMEKMKLTNFQYKNKFACDFSLHRSYFYVKSNYRHKLVEIDLDKNVSTYLNFLENFKTVYHWEVDNGRLYFLINNGNLEWQRILYSYDVDYPRLANKKQP